MGRPASAIQITTLFLGAFFSYDGTIAHAHSWEQRVGYCRVGSSFFKEREAIWPSI